MAFTNYSWLFAVVLLVLLPASISANSKHHQCKRVDAETFLKKRDAIASAPCTGKLVSNHNSNRIPQVINEIVCPAEAGNRCIQLVLPMKVSEVNGQREKMIYVPSGCVDNHEVKKSNKNQKKSSDSNKKNKGNKPHKITRPR